MNEHKKLSDLPNDLGDQVMFSVECLMSLIRVWLGERGDNPDFAAGIISLVLSKIIGDGMAELSKEEFIENLNDILNTTKENSLLFYAEKKVELLKDKSAKALDHGVNDVEL